jgi:hypothetical protein
MIISGQNQTSQLLNRSESDKASPLGEGLQDFFGRRTFDLIQGQACKNQPQPYKSF